MVSMTLTAVKSLADMNRSRRPRRRRPDGSAVVIELGDLLLPVGDPLHFEEEARGARLRVDIIGVGGAVHAG